MLGISRDARPLVYTTRIPICQAVGVETGSFFKLRRNNVEAAQVASKDTKCILYTHILEAGKSSAATARVKGCKRSNR